MYVDGGEFLPLSVWQNRGFNVADIAEKTPPADIASHPVLGKVYRVAIVSTSKVNREGTKRGDCAKQETPSGSSRRARSESSESNETKNRRMKKKQKKEDMRQKQEEKAALAKKKEQEKLQARKVKIAQQILDKLETPVEDMTTNQSAELTMYVPANITTSASAALTELKQILKNVQLVVKSPQRHDLIIENVNEVALKLKECLKLDKKVTTVVASLERVQ